MLSAEDKWKTTNVNDVGHRQDCCSVVNAHWERPRCTCAELDKQDKEARNEN